MTIRSFTSALILFSLLLGGGLALVFYRFPHWQTHLHMAFWSGALFAVICIVLYIIGRNTLHSPDKNAFTNMVFGSVFAKIIVSLLLLFVYKKTMNPGNSLFVAVFLWNYIGYTAFEVWMLLRMAHSAGIFKKSGTKT